MAASGKGRGTGQVRIIGGVNRSRILHFPDSPGLRPTADRVRETLFNWLGQNLEGKTCLDLFAGSGALGFEAASRGACRVVMVESDKRVHRALQENAAALCVQNVELLAGDAVKYLAQNGPSFDVIFVDPPFNSDLAGQAMPLIAGRLAPQGLVYVESGSEMPAGAGWTVWRSGQAGAAFFQLLKWES